MILFHGNNIIHNHQITPFFFFFLISHITFACPSTYVPIFLGSLSWISSLIITFVHVLTLRIGIGMGFNLMPTPSCSIIITTTLVDLHSLHYRSPQPVFVYIIIITCLPTTQDRNNMQSTFPQLRAPYGSRRGGGREVGREGGEGAPLFRKSPTNLHRRANYMHHHANSIFHSMVFYDIWFLFGISLVKSIASLQKNLARSYLLIPLLIPKAPLHYLHRGMVEKTKASCHRQISEHLMMSSSSRYLKWFTPWISKLPEKLNDCYMIIMVPHWKLPSWTGDTLAAVGIKLFL